METEVTKKYRIYRFINDISINGKEIICEDDRSIKSSKAVKWGHAYNRDMPIIRISL